MLQQINEFLDPVVDLAEKHLDKLIFTGLGGYFLLLMVV